MSSDHYVNVWDIVANERPLSELVIQETVYTHSPDNSVTMSEQLILASTTYTDVFHSILIRFRTETNDFYVECDTVPITISFPALSPGREYHLNWYKCETAALTLQKDDGPLILIDNFVTLELPAIRATIEWPAGDWQIGVDSRLLV
jgi:hypothetical protein